MTALQREHLIDITAGENSYIKKKKKNKEENHDKRLLGLARCVWVSIGSCGAARPQAGACDAALADGVPDAVRVF